MNMAEYGYYLTLSNQDKLEYVLNLLTSTERKMNTHARNSIPRKLRQRYQGLMTRRMQLETKLKITNKWQR